MVGTRGSFEESGLDAFIDAYEAAQARDGHADLAGYLPDPTHPLYSTILCELIRVDLEYRWTRGCPLPLEEYRGRFPELFEEPELVREVTFEEERLRRQAEEGSGSEEGRRPGAGGVSGPRASWSAPGPEAGADGSEGTSRDFRNAPTYTTVAWATGSAAGETSELFQTLRQADPRTADRVADALRRLPEPGSDFAGFRLIRELGRGAFGRVYLARQGDLADRLVALKVSADLYGEPQALAQLQHTHVVPIYSAHQVGPLRAVCMPYFGATTLVNVLHDLSHREAPPGSGAALVASVQTSLPGDQQVAAARPPAPSSAALQTLEQLGYVQAVLWIGTRLADALAHAHERGIVHRDLKPANILLTDEGQPMLLDFNLAADTKHDSGAAAALIGGTLPYMAPEALEALRTDPQPADPRGDLYALGVILHEMLTGRHPFPIRRGPVDEVLRSMAADRQASPPRLRPGNPAVTPATESIVRHCLEPDPARRYQSARQLLADLQNQLEDRPLCHAPEPSIRERGGKWVRRHPRLSLATALGTLTALVVMAVVASYNHRQRRFGPVEAALAFRQLGEDYEAARVLLLDPAADPAHRAEGIAHCRHALERYGVLGSSSWSNTPLVDDLPAADQSRLRSEVGEILMLWARTLARQAAGLEPDRRAELVRAALRQSRLAETCYGPEAAPRILWEQRASLAQLAGDRAEAERASARAVVVPVQSAREYALLVIDDPGRATVVEALPALAEASRKDPRDFALWMNLGQCQALQGRLEDAEDSFTIAIVLRPESPWGYFHRGRVELERKAYESARLDFDRVLRLRPGLLPALINRALARMGQREYTGVIADLTRALDRGAAETRLYFLRAEARARSGDREGAERDRAEGLSRTPADGESWVARGLARLHQDPSGALADFREALRLDPKSRSALQNTAAVLSESLGRPAEALPWLDRVVAFYPDFTPARVGRGVLLARLGRRQEAHLDAEDSRNRDPSADTTYRAACVYALTSKTEPSDRPRALRLLATALGQEARWLETARTDPDLDPLRQDDEFDHLLRMFSGRVDSRG